MILSGAVDERGHRQHGIGMAPCPARRFGDELRVIETIGPSPIPPWVISKKLAAGLRQQSARCLLYLHLNPLGRAALARAQMAKFIVAQDRDYDPIRRMARKAERVLLA